MYIINTFEDCYAKVTPQNGWIETYNPNEATKFSTAKEARNWFKKFTAFENYGKPVNAAKAIQKFDKWCKNGMVRRKFKPLPAASRKYNNESPEEVLKWYVEIRDREDDIRFEDRDTWPDLYDVFDCIWSPHSVYANNNETKLLHSFQMCIRKDTKFDVFEKELKLILPFITRKDSEGGLIIDIFDRFLSEDGGVNFIVYKNKYSFVGNYFDIEFKTLKEAFDWWQKERYYE